jgi:hypothetical protein
MMTRKNALWHLGANDLTKQVAIYRGDRKHRNEAVRDERHTLLYSRVRTSFSPDPKKGHRDTRQNNSFSSCPEIESTIINGVIHARPGNYPHSPFAHGLNQLTEEEEFFC